MSSETWVTAVQASELAPGEMVGVELGGEAVAVYNVDGRYYATSNICTHAFSYLTEGWLDGTLIECPLHAGAFDVTTGKGQGAPITCDLKTYPIRLVDGAVQVMVE